MDDYRYCRLMGRSQAIDINFDFRSDTPPGRDPDAFSPTLRSFHKRLWSKHLPSGAGFFLDDTTRGVYLHHVSDLGEFFLSSDAVIPTFTRETRLVDILQHVPPRELDEFNRITYTIGGMMLFPGNRVDRKMTINGARGFHPRIKDRFDLTVECIRRYYMKDPSPLAEALTRHEDFFRLFGDFRGYADYFLLQDILDEAYSTVSFFLPFDGLTNSPLPSSVDAYSSYMQLAVSFVEARNRRLVAWTDT